MHEDERLDAEAIAELDEETMPEVKRRALRSPGTGGDPEHKHPGGPDATNDLTT